MSIEWALGINDAQATGAASRLTLNLREVGAVIGVVSSGSAGLDSRLATLAEAEIDAQLAARQLASAQSELRLAQGLTADSGEDVEAAQLLAARGVLRAEQAAQQAQERMRELATAEADAAQKAQQLAAAQGRAEARARSHAGTLGKMNDRQLDVAIASAKLRDAEKQLQDALGSVDEQSDDLTGTQLELAKAVRQARGDFEQSQRELTQYNRKMEDVRKQSKLSHQALGALGAAAKAGAAAIAAAGVAAGALGAALGLDVFRAQDFARSTQASFASMLGSVEAGEEALDSVRDVARATAAPLEEVRKTYGTLRATGIGDAMARDLAKMRMDWMAMGEEGEAAFGKLSDAMVEGVATASMFEDLTKNLAGMGVSSRMDFGKALGLSTEALGRGEAAAERLDQELKAIDPRKILEVAIATSKANGELGATSKAAASFGQRVGSLRDVGMQRFVDEMGLSGDSIDELLGRVEALTESDAFKSFARSAGDALTGLGNILVDVADFTVEHWDTIGPVLKWTGIAIGVVAGVFAAGAAIMVGALMVIPAVTGAVVAGIIWLETSVADSWDSIVGFFADGAEWVTTSLSELGSSAYGFGENIIGGLVDGIVSGYDAVVEAATGLARRVKDSFANFLGIHSDSRVMIAFGGNIGGGLVTGVAAENDNAERAALGLSRAVERGIRHPRMEFRGRLGAAPSAGGGDGAGSASTSQATASTVSAPGSPQEASTPAPSRTGGPPSVSVIIQPGAIVIGGSGGGVEADIEAAVRAIFARIAAQSGVAA